MLNNLVFGLLFVLFFQNGTSQQYDYGIVMDGGSTHTGLFIYRWPRRFSADTTAPNSIPEEVGFNSANPGISSCCNSLAEIQAYFAPLLTFAKSTLQNQSQNWANYPIYLKATGGMRVLPEQDRINIMNWIRMTLSNETMNPFQFENSNAVILSGEEEAVFGWLSVNVLMNGLKTTPDSAMFGSLDMGGQSTQISFAPIPSSDVLEDCTVVRIFGSTFRVYTQSFLTYGINGMRSQVQQFAYDKQKPFSETNGSFSNPCLLIGYSDFITVLNSTGDQVIVTEQGQGSFSLCSAYIRQLFYNDTSCVTGSCSILGVYHPAINLDNVTFYAFSSFAYTVDYLDLSNTSSLAVLAATAQDICSLFWANFSESSWGQLLISKNKMEYASNYCFQLTYIYTILHHAYQFPLDNTNIIFTNSIHETQLGWTQGSMLRDVNWMPFSLSLQSQIASVRPLFSSFYSSLCLILSLSIVLYQL